MREADSEFERAGRVSIAGAIRYRDGLIIAILVEAPMRRSNLAGLGFEGPLQRVGRNWIIVLAGEDMKTGAGDRVCPLARTFGAASIDTSRHSDSGLLDSDKHAKLWASLKGCPMGAGRALRRCMPSYAS